MDRRDRDCPLLETGQGKVVALSRDLSGARVPPRLSPETPAVRISALIFSPTHIQQLSEGVWCL